MQDLPSIKVGDSFENLEPRQVRVKNPNGVRNDGNVFYAFNERTWIMMGGKFTIVALDGDQILVRYEKGNGEKSRGNEAANGTLFLVNHWKLIKMTVDKLEKSWKTYEQEYVKRLLARAQASSS
jgi:hypothetical protein